jgi:hypothetical protein
MVHALLRLQFVVSFATNICRELFHSFVSVSCGSPESASRLATPWWSFYTLIPFGTTAGFARLSFLGRCIATYLEVVLDDCSGRCWLVFGIEVPLYGGVVGSLGDESWHRQCGFHLISGR